jgi:hypothetical protein
MLRYGRGPRRDVLVSNIAQVIVNYALFLEDNKYFEESFKVYERGVELFNFPVSFEIWNIYLAKFIKRYVCLSFTSYQDSHPVTGRF